MYSLYTPVQVLLKDWATGKPPQVLERLQVYFEGLCLGDVIEIRHYFEYVPHNQDSILLYSFLENKVVPVLSDMDREQEWKANMELRPSVTIEDGRIDLSRKMGPAKWTDPALISIRIVRQDLVDKYTQEQLDTVRCIDMSDNYLGNKEMKFVLEICSVLPNCEVVILRKNKMDKHEAVNHLVELLLQNPKIKWLDLAFAPMCHLRSVIHWLALDEQWISKVIWIPEQVVDDNCWIKMLEIEEDDHAKEIEQIRNSHHTFYSLVASNSL